MRAVAALLACLPVVTPSHAADPKSPDLGFEYQKRLGDYMRLVGEGKMEPAMEMHFKDALTPNPTKTPAADELRKKLASLLDGSGKHVDQELVGYQRVASWMYKVYGCVRFEKKVGVFTYVFLKDQFGNWRLSAFTVRDGTEDLEKLAPFVSFQER